MLSGAILAQSSVSTSHSRLKLQQFLAKPLHADFTFQNACVGQEVAFVQESKFRIGKFQNCSWSFGDGLGFSTKRNPTYTYHNPGIYIVELVVTNSSGIRDTSFKYVEILERPDKPKYSESLTVCEGNELNLESMNLSEKVMWFADKKLKKPLGNSKALDVGEYDEGKYKLYLVNSDYCFSEYQEVSLSVVPNATKIKVERSFCSNDYPIVLSQDGDGGIWFGKGIVERHKGIFDPKLAGPGEHVVTYSDDQNCLNNKEFTIKVIAPPKIEMTLSTNEHGVHIEDNSPIEVDRLWDFGDGNYANQNIYNHSYDEDGAYELSLTIIDGNGCLNTSSEVIEIGDHALSETNLAKASSLKDNLTMYPVPVTGDVLTLDIGSYQADRMIQVQLFDLSGKVVYEKSDIAYYNPKHNIDVSGLNSGTYFARIEVGHEVVSKRIAIK
ncbi:MAG: PKD domain-containing protein [Flavobacteriales bacterium]|nr:PKD domain-containing protein [Flavobacteriales bacterium]